jgi:2-aminoadipate transaminase
LTLSVERRKKLVEIAKRFSTGHRILILEDAAYRELRFDGPEGAEGPSLKRYDPDNGTVIHTTTFSKPFSPGMKTGWTILPTEVVGPLLRIKGNQDFGSSNLNQHLLNRVMADGSYDRQVERLRGVYRGKRNAMVSAVRSAFGHLAGRGCRWTEPTGGLYVWLTLPEGMDTTGGSPLFKAAVEEGVLYVPGDLAYNARPGRPVPKNKIRLCFGVATESEIRTGIARLAAAVAKVYGSNAAAPSAVKEPAGAAAGA